MPEVETSNTGNPPPRIGSYQLLHTLGAGGMSSVFKAVHVETGHEVAVKVLPRALAKNTTLLQRFIREAKSAESLEHPNIVSIFDRGVDQGRHYLVLEYVGGSDLHERVRQGGPLDYHDAVAAIRAVATGLQFAASRGLIHRDIKPANLLMTPTKQVKIIDLGLALQAENEDERVTREGTTVGTVDYMAPEQARDSRATSERSDIYSLGCTFYFLLTGAPPFPGGDISDKLSRHCIAPIPDVRTLRPGIPGPLAILIRRMMAKRPENRFANYQELIDALDLISDPTQRPGLGEQGGEPLYALIDEDGHDELPSLVPLSTSGAALSPQAEPLFAIVDEDEEAPELPAGMLQLVDPDPAGRAGKSLSREDSAPAELRLSELAELDDHHSYSPGPRPPAQPTPREPARNPSRLAEALLEADPGDDHEHGVVLGGTRRYDDPLKKLVITYSLIGVALVAFVIGVHQLYRATSTPASQAEAEESALPPEPASATEPAPPEPAVAAVARPAAPPPVVPKPEPAPRPAPPPAVGVGWIEPTDPESPMLPESDFGAEVESRFLPPWARGPTPRRLGDNFVTVRRVIDPKDPTERHALRLALEVIGGTIEVADNGPFFEDDLRVRGESLLIRAKEGRRPIIVVEPPQLDVVRDQPSVVVLDGKNVVLDGLDFVVNVPQLPLSQTALFQCRGGTLTFSRCTFTIVNPRRKPFALVRTTAGEQPTRVRLERSMVRGTEFSAVDLKDGAADVVLDRSLVVSGGGPVIHRQSGEGTVQLVRTVVSTRGPLLELDAGGGPSRVGRLSLRALGSTFANLAGEGASSLITTGSEGGRPEELLEWAGDHNRFVGWRDWFSTQGGRAVLLPSLEAVRTTWPGVERRSREETSRWRVAQDPLRTTPTDLLLLADDNGGALTRVAAPSPWLLEKTLESLTVPSVPVINRPALGPAAAASTAKSEIETSEASAHWEGRVREVTFNLAAAPWKGDLGRFLRDEIRPGDRRLRVLIAGGGARYSTPIRLPEGLSLEIAPVGGRAVGEPIIWSAPRGAAGDALLEARGGDLVLSNIRMTRDGRSTLKHLVRVERGCLALDGCWLTAPGIIEPNGGDLVAFAAASTEPVSAAVGSGPFQTAVDRPTFVARDTLFLTGGDAIQAVVGRGRVALTNCAIATGGTAFALQASKTARNRFEAGLTIERCTIASEGNFIELGGWPGSAPGPDRPWLVSTRDSVFLGGYDRSGGSTESVLLRVEEDSLEQGLLAWQSLNDSFEVVHFTARAGLPPATPRRSDVTRQWIKLWGEAHMRNTTGPIWPRGGSVSAPSVRLLGRLQAGKVAPADLEIDRGYHPGRPVMNLGADLSRLQIKTRKSDRR